MGGVAGEVGEPRAVEPGGVKGGAGFQAGGIAYEPVPTVPSYQYRHAPLHDVMERLEKAEKRLVRRLERSGGVHDEGAGEDQGRLFRLGEEARRAELETPEGRRDTWFGRGAVGGPGVSASVGIRVGKASLPDSHRVAWSSAQLPYTCTLRAETNASTHHIPVFIHDGGVHISSSGEEASGGSGLRDAESSGVGRVRGVKERLLTGLTRPASCIDAAGLPPDAR